MAHHQKQQADAKRRGSAVQSLLKMFNLSNAPRVPLGEEEVAGEADEPPDDQLVPLERETIYTKSPAPPKTTRRESLLTQAIRAESQHEDTSPASLSAPHGPGTTSSRSTASMASTAELTSDGDATSPARSASPSPPPPSGRLSQLFHAKDVRSPARVVIAPITKDDRPDVAEVGEAVGGEAAVEKSLGRKRRIMFAGAGEVGRSPKESNEAERAHAVKDGVQPAEPVQRKCALTFACPTRQDSDQRHVSSTLKPRPDHNHRPLRRPSPAPFPRRKSSSESPEVTSTLAPKPIPQNPSVPKPSSPTQSFHEFGSSYDETDAWVDRPSDNNKPKLTLDDCMRKENRIRQIGQEAEEEAEEEEREQLEAELDEEDNDNEDDFAPSDEDDSSSDGGNESDDEGGFASSDEESDAGSDYQFWAPSTITAAANSTTTISPGPENVGISHFSSRQRLRSDSVGSLTHSTSPPSHSVKRPLVKRLPSKGIKMRPGTPELPDSTDFVCGTLDEDRPLEAAYISCREQKKREKHIPIPQDIDPSFPTTDPEDNDDHDDEEDQSQHGGSLWLKDQFASFDDDIRGRGRGKGKTSTVKASPVGSPTPPSHPAVPFKHGDYRRLNNRSPPPPRRLFGHSPTRLRSPPPRVRLRSPPGSPTSSNAPMQLMAYHLAQRPKMERTASLPHTPNPFFRNFRIGSPSISNIASGAVTPAAEEPPRPDMHVRGPVDIVIGLEKKRQKRKEKFWRQHCRKAAREQAERRLAPGRGAERMKELGLECAERTRGYGLGQHTHLVLSL